MVLEGSALGLANTVEYVKRPEEPYIYLFAFIPNFMDNNHPAAKLYRRYKDWIYYSRKYSRSRDRHGPRCRKCGIFERFANERKYGIDVASCNVFLSSDWMTRLRSISMCMPYAPEINVVALGDYENDRAVQAGDEAKNLSWVRQRYKWWQVSRHT